jgi:hypothetical protein
MMKKITFLILLCLATVSLKAQISEEIKLTVKVTNIPDSLNLHLACGLHQNATNGLDTLLGETDRPPFLPPGGGWSAYFAIPETDTSDIWTRIDLRPYPAEEKFAVTYKLKTFFDKLDTMFITWDKFPVAIDSILLTDRIDDWDIPRTSLLELDSLVLTNHFIQEYDLTVYYDLTKVGVETKNTVNGLIYPQPANDYINIGSEKMLGNYRIFDNCGAEIKQGLHSDSKIYVYDLNTGVYFIKFDNDNTVYKFIKK